jgi:hypothetical protein
VAATSAHNAWAVGWGGIEHWNGAAWRRQMSPQPTQFEGVAALSSANAWAVGFNSKSINPFYTQIQHWNGRAWRVQKSPSFRGQNNFLYSVAATSSTNAWAVGQHDNDTGGDAATNTKVWSLVEHWNGRAWKVQKTPNIGTLFDVAATSRTNAWAVGPGGILHWNGTAWTRKKSPSPVSGSNAFFGVAATSRNNAWAVGANDLTSTEKTLVEHWNGTAWKIQNSPNPGKLGSSLTGVATNGSTNVWTVGTSVANGYVQRNLALHWNGAVWGP